MGTTLLTDPGQRRTLLQQISRNVPKSRTTGQQSWKLYFEQNPTESVMLGYDQIKTNPKLWAANLRMTHQRNFKKELRNGDLHIPGFATEAPEMQKDIADLQEQAYQECKAENKNLREQIKSQQVKEDRLRAELIEAKDVTFELLIQLQRAKVQIMELRKG